MVHEDISSSVHTKKIMNEDFSDIFHK